MYRFVRTSAASVTRWHWKHGRWRILRRSAKEQLVLPKLLPGPQLPHKSLKALRLGIQESNQTATVDLVGWSRPHPKPVCTVFPCFLRNPRSRAGGKRVLSPSLPGNPRSLMLGVSVEGAVASLLVLWLESKSSDSSKTAERSCNYGGSPALKSSLKGVRSIHSS